MFSRCGVMQPYFHAEKKAILFGLPFGKMFYH